MQKNLCLDNFYQMQDLNDKKSKPLIDFLSARSNANLLFNFMKHSSKIVTILTKHYKEQKL